MVKKLLILISVSLIISSCALPKAYDGMLDRVKIVLKEKASVDLNCPEKDINIIVVGDGTFPISGCGKSVKYEVGCGGPNVKTQCYFKKI